MSEIHYSEQGERYARGCGSMFAVASGVIILIGIIAILTHC